MISLKLSQVHAGYALRCMFAFPCLGVLREVKRVPAFPKIFNFDNGSSIKVSLNQIEKMFPLGMVQFIPAGHAINCADLKGIK